jgi:gamma-glutamylcyclotransferase (GGCT)/AIG2-like uncharacterized protein YtfP
MPNVAVYGTLREGFSNHRLLETSTLLGADVLNGFEMYTAGGFPVIYPTNNDDSIVIEVYECSDETLNGPLDSLEGHPSWYRRQLVDTQFGKAWVYVMQSQAYKRNNKILSGDWSDRNSGGW